MYLRVKDVTLRYRLNGGAGIRPDDDPQASPHNMLGGIVEVRDGRKYVRALDNVSLELKQGDRLAIIGHNGSGKSTLLKTMAGIYHPQVGRVESDRPVTGLFNISMGFRTEASGYRNIFLKGLIAGKTRAEIERAIPEIAEFTELGPYLHMPIRTYSQGMAVRLAFAIATAFSSEILLMDEWIGAGDAQFSNKIVKRMTGFVESAHILVLASHNGPLLRRAANRAIWMEAGRIREEGPVDELLARYEAQAKARAIAARALNPIHKEKIAFTVSPTEMPDFKPGDKPVVGKVAWDAGESGVASIELFVINREGKESACCRGPAVGEFTTGAWLRPGVRFRLNDAETGEAVAEATVLPPPESTPAEKRGEPSIEVTPAELPDFKPGDKPVAGELRWDAGKSKAESVEIHVARPDGEERLLGHVGRVGSMKTLAWIRPGVSFKMVAGDTGELLACVVVGSHASMPTIVSEGPAEVR